MYPKLEGNLDHCCAPSFVNKITASHPQWCLWTRSLRVILSDVCEQGLYKPQIVLSLPTQLFAQISVPIPIPFPIPCFFSWPFLPIQDYYYNLFKLHMWMFLSQYYRRILTINRRSILRAV